MTNSFQWGEATISARELTIGDEDTLLRMAQNNRFPEGALVNSADPFMRFMVTAEVDGVPPVPMVSDKDSLEDWQASYAVWLQLPARFKKQWVAISEAADNSPNG